MNASAFATRLAGIEAAVGKCAEPAQVVRRTEPPPFNAASTHRAEDQTALKSVGRVTPRLAAGVEFPSEVKLESVDTTLHAGPLHLATRIDFLRHQLDVVNGVLRRLV